MWNYIHKIITCIIYIWDGYVIYHWCVHGWIYFAIILVWYFYIVVINKNVKVYNIISFKILLCNIFAYDLEMRKYQFLFLLLCAQYNKGALNIYFYRYLYILGYERENIKSQRYINASFNAQNVYDFHELEESFHFKPKKIKISKIWPINPEIISNSTVSDLQLFII